MQCLLSNKVPRLRDSLGAVILETAVVMPMLLLFAFATIDLGRWLDLRYHYQRVVYETARYGSSISAIRPENNIELGVGQGKSSYDEATAQGQMLKRMNFLLAEYGLHLSEAHEVKVLYSSDGNFSNGSGAERSIRIVLVAPFNPILPDFMSVTKMTVKADSPYLYPIS